jgi:hypothetical protein
MKGKAGHEQLTCWLVAQFIMMHNVCRISFAEPAKHCSAAAEAAPVLPAIHPLGRVWKMPIDMKLMEATLGGHTGGPAASRLAPPFAILYCFPGGHLAQLALTSTIQWHELGRTAWWPGTGK